MTRPSFVPPHAELHSHGKFWRTEEVPSRFLPNTTAKVHHFVCLACNEKLPRPSSVRTTTCKCGLVYVNEVDGVYVWKAEEVAA